MMTVWKKILAALLFTALEPASSLAQPDIEAYGALPFVSSIDLSPDGEYFAAIANMDDKRVLLVGPINGDQNRLVLGISNHKARGVSFFGPDHIILHVSMTTEANNSRYDYEYGGAFAFHIDSAESTQLLYRTRNLHPRQSGIGYMVARNIDK
ncbi:MAG: hypothetical protein AAF829_10155 [Pseudomonadota bacterium]